MYCCCMSKLTPYTNFRLLVYEHKKKPPPFILKNWRTGVLKSSRKDRQKEKGGESTRKKTGAVLHSLLCWFVKWKVGMHSYQYTSHRWDDRWLWADESREINTALEVTMVALASSNRYHSCVRSEARCASTCWVRNRAFWFLDCHCCAVCTLSQVSSNHSNWASMNWWRRAAPSNEADIKLSNGGMNVVLELGGMSWEIPHCNSYYIEKKNRYKERRKLKNIFFNRRRNFF